MPTPTSPLRRRTWLAGCLASACALSLGCQVFVQPPEKALDSLLQPIKASPDSVSLEVFQARIPLDQDKKADAIWEQIDEQKFGADLRRKLVANGLRAGIVGGTLPSDLATLLDVNGPVAAESGAQVITDQSAVPRVTRSVVRLKPRDSRAIQVSDVRNEAQVMISDNGVLGGRPFRQLQSVYSLQAEPIPGQRAKIRITPELQHGDMKQRYAGSSERGIIMSITSRDREVFEELAMESTLAPGELLVLGCLPDAKTSIGGVFHTASVAGKDERKLIIIRLAQVPPSEILAQKK